MKLPLTVIILTYNEEVHIKRCLENISDWAEEIFIVDSFSTDKTLDIVRKWIQENSRRSSATIVQHKFENQAQQFNWALDNLPIKTEWILRLDADEYLTKELKDEIADLLSEEGFSFSSKPKRKRSLTKFCFAKFWSLGVSGLREKENPPSINGYYIKRRVYFMGRWIKRGGYYPTWILRLFRKDKARSEEREMDEHIVLLAGKAGKLKNDFVDDNKKDLSWWINKHVDYASREAREVLSGNYGRGKKKFYYTLPLFFRVFLYFFFRYFILLGFLDGKEGLIFHFLQGFWYRLLIDAKIYETKNKN